MKVAMTADVHLGIRDDHPERYNALRNILEQMSTENLDSLIIAGDLFDKDFRNYSEFEGLCSEYPGIRVHIIPGNHDQNISESNIVGENIKVYTDPYLKMFDTTKFLFIPYVEGAHMGEQIAGMGEEIGNEEWVLVAHGDYYGGQTVVNPMEPGMYMPITRAELDGFRPKIALLGHIHKPWSSGRVRYPGSPCGLNINETGHREFLVYDTANGGVVSRRVETDVLYFKEKFFVVPMENEESILRDQIKERIQEWGIEPANYGNVRIRIEAVGFAMNRQAISQALQEGLDGFMYYKNEGPNIDNLSESADPQLSHIAERTIELIDDGLWNFGGDQPERDDVVIAALKVIYES